MQGELLNLQIICYNELFTETYMSFCRENPCRVRILRLDYKKREKVKSMARRFSDIEQGGIYKLALDNLTKYRADAATRTSPRITGSGTPKNRIQSKVAIIPFYTEVTAETLAAAQLIVGAAKTSLEGTENFAKTVLDNYYDGTPNDKAKPAPKGYTPSRCRVFNPTSETAKYTKSKFTGLYYAKREGIGYSLPIGRKAPGDREEAVQAQILSDLTAEINTEPYRRVNFTDEKPPGL